LVIDGQYVLENVPVDPVMAGRHRVGSMVSPAIMEVNVFHDIAEQNFLDVSDLLREVVGFRLEVIEEVVDC